MEGNSSLHSPKLQKVSEEGNFCSDETHIDDLPEPILVHILSFLPTLDAVKASIVSKKWKYLWMYCTSLHFENVPRDDSERKVFMDAVDRVFSLREPVEIYQFTLECQMEADEVTFGEESDEVEESGMSHVNSWLCIALDRKVKVLNLHFYNILFYALPSSLFKSNSLTELKLDFFDDLGIPNDIYLPSLKILTLKHVSVEPEESMHRLFSGCRVLETLTLDECTWDGDTALTISIITLKTLIIYESYDDEGNCQVTISGVNLRTFDYGGDLKNEYNLSNLSSLVDSSIVVDTVQNIVAEGRQEEVAYRAHKLLRGLSNARDLYLSHGTVKVLDYATELFPSLPMYYNLTFLKVNLGLVDFNCGALQRILQNSPLLNTLEFIWGITLNRAEGEGEWKLDPVPPCFKTQLKNVYIGEYSGTKDELQVAKIVLINARVLERLCLKLASCEGVSNTCVSMPLEELGCEVCFHV